MLVEIRQKLSSTYTPLVSGSPKAKPLLSALENAFSRNNIGGILKQHTRVKIPLLLSSYFRINVIEEILIIYAEFHKLKSCV